MPNYCDYEMRVQGAPESVDEFIKVIQTDYDFDENGNCICEAGRHFWRVFYAEVVDDGIDNGIKSVMIAGYCAWSVYSCMCDGEWTYNNDHPDGKGTTLQKESENLQLAIEVFSSEPGNAFMEHFVYVKGECLFNDCVDYNEYATDDFETVEEMNEAYGTEFTQEEFENNDFLSTGGIEWDYENWL